MSSASGKATLAPAKKTWSETMSTINYSFVAYVFLCIVIGFTAISQLMQSGRQWTAILVGIFFVTIFIFYGTRWFSNGKMKGYYTGVWPPLINTCPDYLVYYKKGTKDTCVDLIGVNRSGGLLRSWSIGDSPQNPPADNAKYFNYVYKPGMSPADMQVLCDAAQKSGLTWEGITNGDSCTFGTASTVLGPESQQTPSCAPALQPLK